MIGRLRRVLDDGGTPLGVWQFVPHPDVSALIAACGYDFVVIDTEHAPTTDEQLGQCIISADAAGIDVVVRIRQKNVSHLVQRALDSGAAGILAPMIETPEEAVQLVSAARFPPDGNRGWCTETRTAQWGHLDGFDTELARRVLVSAIVETPLGFENLQELTRVPGLDAVMIGGGDLHVRRQLRRDDPRIAAEMRTAASLVVAADRLLWLSVTTAESGAMVRELGARIVCCAFDTRALSAELTARRELYLSARDAPETERGGV